MIIFPHQNWTDHGGKVTILIENLLSRGLSVIISIRNKNSLVVAGLLFWGIASNPIQAADLLEPYAIANRNPFVQIYGLPTARSAELTPAGTFSTALQLELSSNFTVSSEETESIFIDGETYRTNFQLRVGVSDKLELGLDIPYLSHDGGSLDGFIDSWHNVFGLPDGGRSSYPEDQLRFSYEKDGQEMVNLNQAKDGLGDVDLNAMYQLPSTATRQWALRGQVKLPTGEVEDLLGSDSTDVAVALHLSDRSWFEKTGIALHGSVGLLWMGEGAVLDNIRKDWVVYGSTTLAWQASEHVSLKLQLDAHTAFYDSGLTELGSESAQLTLGGAVKLSERWVVNLAVSEDIVVDTAPDVVFLIGIKGGNF